MLQSILTPSNRRQPINFLFNLFFFFFSILCSLTEQKKIVENDLKWFFLQVISSKMNEWLLLLLFVHFHEKQQRSCERFKRMSTFFYERTHSNSYFPLIFSSFFASKKYFAYSSFHISKCMNRERAQ